MQLAAQREAHAAEYRATRCLTETLCAPLSTEDYVVQTMPDVSPAKWHLGHTTWFFENVILKRFARNYASYNDQYDFLFNSYYEALGPRIPRPERGHLSRPTVAETMAYRQSIDLAMSSLLAEASSEHLTQLLPLVRVGLAHEQQHQELLVTDLKHVFAQNPLRPCFTPAEQRSPTPLGGEQYIGFDGGLISVGVDSDEVTFAYDNETPPHLVHIEPYELCERTVTNGEYLAFMLEGGYTTPSLWLADGWDRICQHRWNSPLYWQHSEAEGWMQMTLHGWRCLDPNEPVCHVSYYEADAYARWAQRRLPREQEWEHAAETSATQAEEEARLLNRGALQPQSDRGALTDMLGNVWEWTQSAYLPYPGYRPYQGALAEYNGKFMSNQMVLRGGSCATPAGHIRPTYRNFFQPDKRWQFAGIRLAK